MYIYMFVCSCSMKYKLMPCLQHIIAMVMQTSSMMQTMVNIAHSCTVFIE